MCLIYVLTEVFHEVGEVDISNSVYLHRSVGGWRG